MVWVWVWVCVWWVCVYVCGVCVCVCVVWVYPGWFIEEERVWSGRIFLCHRSHLGIQYGL